MKASEWILTDPALTDPDVERARALDRAYFEQHPEASVYFRTLVPGEFDRRISERVYLISVDDIAKVRVEQLAPGVRIRTGLPFFRGPE